MSDKELLPTLEEQEWINQFFEERKNPIETEIIEEPDLLEQVEVKGGEQNMPQEVDYNSYEIPTTGGTFFKVETGENTIRLASAPLELKLHPIEGDKFSTVACEGENCGLCAKNVKINYKYPYIMISRRDNKAYIYEAPIMVFRQIIALAKNPKWGDPTKYDLNIHKEGEKLGTKYMVMPEPPIADLTDVELTLIGKSGLSLVEQYQKS